LRHAATCATPSAIGRRRGQAAHDGLPRFNQMPLPPAADALTFCKGPYRFSNLTPGITRRPAPLLPMTPGVSAVGCMPLLGRGPGASMCISDGREGSRPCEQRCPVNHVRGNIVLEYTGGFQPAPEDAGIDPEFVFDLSAAAD
jgi:hypothetical protein